MVLKNEAIAEIKIGSWLLSSGCVNKVLLNRKGHFPVFKVKSSKNREKPDMLIITKNNNIYAIEIKHSKDKKNIRDSIPQLLGYHFDYIDGIHKYFVDDVEINVDGFLLCTDSCIEGTLYENEKIVDAAKLVGGHKLAVEMKLCPAYEGENSFEFVRGLWSSQKREQRKHKESNKKTELGLLRSYDNKNKSPFLQIKKKNNRQYWGVLK